MKKIIFSFLIPLLLLTGAWGQVQFGNQIGIKSVLDSIPASKNITTQDVGSTVTPGFNSQNIITGTPTANSTANFLISGKQTLRVLVSGTWTGTLQSEISIDHGTTWAITGIHLNGTSYTSATFTANFTGNLNVASVTNYRLRATAAVTGTATVNITTSMNGSTFYLANGVRITDATTQSQQLAISAAGAAKVDGSAVTQPISASSLPLPTGAATSAKQPALGVAGTASADVITIQGIASMTAIKVDGSGVTQPVSGTVTVNALPAGTAIIGKVTTDQTTHGTTDLVAADLTKIGGVTFSTGQKNQTASIPVTLSNQNIKDSMVTGQSAQTATVNNILTTTAGSAATDVTGYRSMSVQVVSTASGGTFIFEYSNDNVSWNTLNVFNKSTTSSTVTNSAITATSSTVTYIGPIDINYVRLRIASTITGGTIQAFTRLSQTAFSPSVYNVSNSSGSNLNTSGQTLHSASIGANNPFRTGGAVAPATPDLTLVAGDAANTMMTTGQQEVGKPYAPGEWDFTFNGVITNSTTASVFKNAAGASIRNYVTSIVVNSDALATASEIVIKDGAVTSSSVSANVLTSGTHDYKIGDAVVFSAIGSYTGIVAGTTYYVLTVPSATTYTLSVTANGSTLTVGGSGSATSNRILFRSKLQTTSFGPASFTFPTPLRGMTNGTLDFQCVTASVTGSVYYNISGYIGF